MSKTTPVYRAATPADLDALLQLRLAMFEAMGIVGPELDAAIEPMRAYFAEQLPSGNFRAWLADVDGVPIASIGWVIHSTPPSPFNPTGKHAYLMNLVTLPAYRRQGIARKLMHLALDIIQKEGISNVSLHASPEGRALYEEFGFSLRPREDNPIMELTLRNANGN